MKTIHNRRCPKEVEEGIIKGYIFPERWTPQETVQLLGSGTILREVIAAGDLLEKDFGVYPPMCGV